MRIRGDNVNIRTDRLIIRTIKEEDYVDIYEIYNNPKTCQYIPSGVWNENNKLELFLKKLSHQSLQGNGRIDLSCIYKNKVIGNVGVWNTGMKDCVEIGYVFHYDYQGRGLAFEALKAIIPYIFKEFKIHRIQTNIDSRNKASYLLCERLGMRREAHFIKDYWFNGEWTDSYIYGMLEEEIKEESY